MMALMVDSSAGASPKLLSSSFRCGEAKVWVSHRVLELFPGELAGCPVFVLATARTCLNLLTLLPLTGKRK